MAFYTSRVDDSGNEIERRQSARSILSLKSNSTTSSHINLSSRSSDCGSNYRYVNSAAYIEKNSELSETGSLYEDNKFKGILENGSDIVPPLDLTSEENFPTTRDTYSYRKHIGAPKLELRPDLAYENWLSAKRKMMNNVQARRKQEEEQKRIEQENRKRLAEAKYQEWLMTKSRDSKTRSVEKIKSQPEMDSKPSKPRVNDEQAQAKLEEWERIKRIEEEQRRLAKRQEEQQRRELEEQRRQMAAEAWEKWIAEAANKPKPVPLNRGIFTLRGTISDIFVNPNEWQKVDIIHDEN